MPLASDYYLDPVSGNDSNNGLTTTTAWKTVDKCKSTVLDVLPTEPDSTGYVTIHLLNSVSGDVNLLAGWHADGPTGLAWDGSMGMVANGTATLTTVTPANPATPQEWVVHIAGFDFSTRIGQIAMVDSGANAGVGFVVVHDLGSGSAIVSEPNLFLSYDFTGDYVISAGDPITFWTFPQLGDSLQVTGPGNIAFQALVLGTPPQQHGVAFYGSMQMWMDTCILTSFDWNAGGYAYLTGCYINLNTHVYQAGTAWLQKGGSNGAFVTHTGGTIVFVKHTHTDGEGIVGESILEPGTYIVYDWLCISHCTSAVNLSKEYRVITEPYPGFDVRIFGTNVSGTKIIVGPGSVCYYDAAKPWNITGGGTDSNISGTTKTFGQWPFSAGNLARTVET